MATASAYYKITKLFPQTAIFIICRNEKIECEDSPYC